SSANSWCLLRRPGKVRVRERMLERVPRAVRLSPVEFPPVAEQLGSHALILVWRKQRGSRRTPPTLGGALRIQPPRFPAGEGPGSYQSPRIRRPCDGAGSGKFAGCRRRSAEGTRPVTGHTTSRG